MSILTDIHKSVKVTAHESDRDGWLNARKKNINSTDVALFFKSKHYQRTYFDLHNEKKNGTEPKFEPNFRATVGSMIEPFILQLFNQEYGHIYGKAKEQKNYLASEKYRLGSSYDAYNKDYIVEIKNVDKMIHNRTWINNAPPLHIALQVQVQMLLSGWKNAVVVAFVGGNELICYDQPAHEPTQLKIVERLQRFWGDIDKGVEVPDIDFNYFTL